MKVYEASSVVLIFICLALVTGLASTIFLDDDNEFEETAEEFIEHHTGIDLDLSPDSPEQ